MLHSVGRLMFAMPIKFFTGMEFQMKILLS